MGVPHEHVLGLPVRRRSSCSPSRSRPSRPWPATRAGDGSKARADCRRSGREDRPARSTLFGAPPARTSSSPRGRAARASTSRSPVGWSIWAFPGTRWIWSSGSAAPRFFSRHTILVDTFVVKDSREADPTRGPQEARTDHAYPRRPREVRVRFPSRPCSSSQLVIDTTGADLTVDDQAAATGETVQRSQDADEFHRRFSDHHARSGR